VTGSFWDYRIGLTPDAPFLSFGGQSWSYGEFDRWVNSLAHGLAGLGVGPETRVAILLPNSAQVVRLYLAVMKLGAIIAPVMTKAAPADVAYVLGHCGARLLVTDAAGYSLAEAGGAELPAVVLLGGSRAGAIPFGRLDSGTAAGPVAAGPRDPSGTFAIMYTSGSTARPKGVMLPEAGLWATGRAVADRLGLTPADNMACVLPLFHAGGTHLALASAIAAGCRFTLSAAFSARGFWPMVRASSATHVNLVPGMISILQRTPRLADDTGHGLRVVITAAAEERFARRFGVRIVTTWSMTELSAMGTMNRPGAGLADRGVGQPLRPDVEIGIFDEAGTRRGPGQEGEIWCRHPFVMSGYLDDDAATAAAMAGGWVRSGDLGMVDEHGALFFRGRLKNLIKRHGENISGDELEHVLAAHPAVVECLVFGVFDPVRTEEACAVVVTDEAADDLAKAGPATTSLAQQLAGWCAEQGLPDWKIPRYIAARTALLPRLPGGKADRRAIASGLSGTKVFDRDLGSLVPADLRPL
jgi:carnitine-CoA ligase